MPVSPALESILLTYQAPLRSHLTKRFGMTEDEAADCLHSFVEEKILEKGMLARANRQRGRFRTFLLTSLERFAISKHRHRSTQRRAPEIEPLPLHELTEKDEIFFAVSPSTEFEIAWARTVIATAMDRMQAECSKNGRRHVWGVFESRLLKPILEGSSPTPYHELISKFDLESPTQAFNVLVTGKRVFGRHLRAVVQEYARDAQEVDKELCALFNVLAHA